MNAFTLDPRLAADTIAVTQLGLCELRLMNDRRWPWVVLVPHRPETVELHDLTPLDQTTLAFETSLVSKVLKTATGAGKMNVATLGNVVAMFHLHIVARNVDDPNWPGPVWGFGTPEPYEPDAAEALIGRLNDLLRQA